MKDIYTHSNTQIIQAYLDLIRQGKLTLTSPLKEVKEVVHAEVIRRDIRNDDGDIPSYHTCGYVCQYGKNWVAAISGNIVQNLNSLYT